METIYIEEAKLDEVDARIDLINIQFVIPTLHVYIPLFNSSIFIAFEEGEKEKKKEGEVVP